MRRAMPFEDAPRVFGPQKGADAAMVKRLERRLAELAVRLRAIHVASR